MRYLMFFFLLIQVSVFAQKAETPEMQMAKGFAKTIMTTYPDSIVVKKFVQHMLQDKEGSDPSKRAAIWNYEEAVTLNGMLRLWKKTEDQTYFRYAKKSLIISFRRMGKSARMNHSITTQIR